MRRSLDFGQLPNQDLVNGMDLLPPCGPNSTEQHIEVDVPLTGRFRVTFRPRKQARRGWPTTWIWLPIQAERLDIRETPEL